MTTEFPDGPVDGFPQPPRTFTDLADRDIQIRRLEADETEALVAMYDAFDPEDRAQGIPPSTMEGVREWLDAVFEDDCLNLVAWHADSAVGHVMLVPDRSGAYELAIFVLQSYQGAHIGTELVRTGLGAGEAERIERVWLTVERWNSPAVSLYQKIGFETTDNSDFEMEMSLRLEAEE